LYWLDRLSPVVAILYGAALYATGAVLNNYWPQLRTNGPQLFVWGFFISTVVLYHATYSVNSLAHLFGERRYSTDDHSRNNWLVAILTLGEGWHNNHHYYPSAARQGFFWWEFDVTYYTLYALERLGLVWQLRPVPESVLDAGRKSPRVNVSLN
jgi:stearoyl-CoA desaturase (delta-9 desaturase)